ATIRYVIKKCLPSKRFNIEIEDISTDDVNIIVEDIIKRFESILLSFDTPEVEFELNTVNNSLDSYVYINSSSIKLKSGNINNFCNNIDLFALGMGKHISITGKVQKDNGINNNINYDISYLFKRN